jgi:hypothetical protein
MAAATSTLLSAIYKELFGEAGDLPRQVMYRADPLLGEVRKNEKFGGNSINFPLQIRGGANTAGTVADAQTNTQPNLYVDFSIPATARHLRHAVCQWERQAIQATLVAGDRGAFVRGFQRLIEGQSYSLMQFLAKEIWGTGGQALCQIASGAAGLTVTLTDPDTITNIEVGMVLQAASADPGVSGAGVVRVGSATVTAVNRETFTFTLGAGITSLTDGDFLFQFGDIVAGDYAVGGRGMRGVGAWVPRTAPGATPFFGVVRNQDVTRTAGYRLNAQGQSLTAAVRLLGTFMYQQGATCDRVYVSVRNWQRLLDEGHAQSVIQCGPTDQHGKLVIGYDNIEIVTAAGKVKVLCSNKVPNDLIYMLNLGDWELASLQSAPVTVRDDSLEFIRQANANIFELRMLYDAALICYNPGQQGVAIVTPPSF